MTRELRNIKSELRLDQPSDKPSTIVGYAAVFNAPSQVMESRQSGPFTEVILPGAFSESIKSDDVVALFNHDNDHLLGRTKSGTLSLSEDDHGLAIVLTPPDTQLGHDTRELISRGDLSGMSFGFICQQDEWNDTPSGLVRTLVKVTLTDISVVTNPAYLQTEVDLRSYDEFRSKQEAPVEPVPHNHNIIAKILLAHA